MKNEAEIIWWKTVKQDVETTPRRFTGAGARVAPPRQAKRQARGGGWKLDDKNIFKRIPPHPPPLAIIILREILIDS